MLLQVLGLLVVCTVSCVHAARSGQPPPYSTIYACEGKTLRIECGEGQLIHLIRANYGRFSITICNDHGHTDWSVSCMSPKSLRVLHQKCSMQNNCTISADTSLFTDPCPGTLKYLEAHYRCVSSANFTTPITKSIGHWLTTSPSYPYHQRPQKNYPSAPPIFHRKHGGGGRMQSPHTESTPREKFEFPERNRNHYRERSSTTSTVSSTATSSSTTPLPSLLFSTPSSNNDDASLKVSLASPPSGVELTSLCAPETSRGLTWNWTLKGDTQIVPCPAGSNGYARWKCLEDPLLNIAIRSPNYPDLSGCRSVWITSLDNRLGEGESILTIIGDLAKVTDKKVLYGGDMLAVTKIIHDTSIRTGKDVIAFQDDKQKEAVSTDLVSNIVAVGSNLLDELQYSSWADLSLEEQLQVASSLVLGLEESAFLLAEAWDTERTVNLAYKNILISIHVIELDKLKKTSERFPLVSTLDDTNTTWQNRRENWIEIKASSFYDNSVDDITRVVYSTYERLHEVLIPIEMRNSSLLLNSRIIGASLGSGKHISLKESILVGLEHIRTENMTDPICVFWDYQSDNWSTDGCELYSTNKTFTICECTHLTNFALLMRISEESAVDIEQICLKVLTYVGCVLSCICLLVSFFTFHLMKTLKSERFTIHKNLCLSLFIAEIVFIVGVAETNNPLLCSAVAVLLHYFFLCSFVWMLLEGFQLYVMLIEVFEVERSRIKWYYLFGYGFPLIVVSLCSFFFPGNYGTTEYCWLAPNAMVLYSFILPIGFVIVINLVFLSMTIVVMCRHANKTLAVKKPRDQSRSAFLRTWLRGALFLSFLLGLTWAFGILHIIYESLISAYLFTIFNTLQGVFIFVFHCLLNEKIRNEYKVLLGRVKCLKRLTGSGQDSANLSRERERTASREARSTTQTPAGNSSVVHSSATSTQENSPHHHPSTLQEPTYAPRSSHYSRYDATYRVDEATSPSSTGGAYGYSSSQRGRSHDSYGRHHYPSNSSQGSAYRLRGRSDSPWNHIYYEIKTDPESRREEDPVYEEIERRREREMREREGEREREKERDSDRELTEEELRVRGSTSRHSSRSYADHRPLIPYNTIVTTTDPEHRNFRTALNAAFRQRLREQQNAQTVAVLDGDTVVCHLQQEQPALSPDYSSRRRLYSRYSEGSK